MCVCLRGCGCGCVSRRRGGGGGYSDGEVRVCVRTRACESVCVLAVGSAGTGCFIHLPHNLTQAKIIRIESGSTGTFGVFFSVCVWGGGEGNR